MDALRKTVVLLHLRRNLLYQKISSSWKPVSYFYSTCQENVPECTSNAISKNPHEISIMEFAKKHGINDKNVLEALKNSHEISIMAPSHLEKYVEELQLYGFKRTDCVQMMILHPPLVALVNQNSFDIIMAQWVNSSLGYENVLELLKVQPYLISLKYKEFSRRIALLRSLTGSRGNRIKRLLLGCPNIMFENWSDLEERVRYIENVMKIDIKKEDLSRSYMFNRPLEEIKTRHVFLKRSGLYITPEVVKGTKIQQNQQPWSKNPYLRQITDVNDSKFLSQFHTNLTLEELEVFREIYKKELGEENEDNFSDNE